MQRRDDTVGSAPDSASVPSDPAGAFRQGMYFATGIENSNPTIGDGRIRIDEMESCGHYRRRWL